MSTPADMLKRDEEQRRAFESWQRDLALLTEEWEEQECNGMTAPPLIPEEKP